jgi:UPF0755 protein
MRKLYLGIGIFIIATVGWGFNKFYADLFRPCTYFVGESKVILVPTGSTMDELKAILLADSIIVKPRRFDILAKQKKFKTVKPGRYRIPGESSISDVINLLRSGEQEPVRVTFNNIRTIPEALGKVSAYLETDSLALVDYFFNPNRSAEFGLAPETFSCMFMPDTYEFFWNTTPEGFGQRMKSEYEKFWNSERKAKAYNKGMTPEQVVTLASIVKEETAKLDEAPKIAGVYLNRLKIGMPLQADPTLKFALSDFTIRRLLEEDKKVDSPYNTYENAGLPPGPINLPEAPFINAVLNAESHDYYYFCARSDFSGYHNFSKTLAQHNAYAAEYHRALNKRGIYR